MQREKVKMTIIYDYPTGAEFNLRLGHRASGGASARGSLRRGRARRILCLPCPRNESDG